MLFAQSIATFDTQIDAIKVQIEELRIKLSNLETEKQNLLAVEQMWESAISQIKSAKDATQAIGQNNLIDDAKTAIDAVFSDLPLLPEKVYNTEVWDDADKEINAQSPSKPIDPTEGVIDVSATETTEQNESETTETTEKIDDGFDNVSWHKLRKFAASYGVTTKHKTKLDIVLALKAKGITRYTDDTQVS